MPNAGAASRRRHWTTDRRASKETLMNKDTIEGNWRQIKGKVKERWGKLTDDELDQVEGNYDILCGKIQKAYGLSRDEVERDLSRLN
jgi:uncharacterized protein YjbJ (UPF0337 family)